MAADWMKRENGREVNGWRGEKLPEGDPVGNDHLFFFGNTLKTVGISGRKITLKPSIQNEIKSTPVQRPAAKESYP